MTFETDIALPENTRPIVIIGAGGIVNDAHLPAYRLAGFPVAGIYDLDREKALKTAEKWRIPMVYQSMKDMLSRGPAYVVFDVAVPGSDVLSVLRQLPQKAVVLMQKPMGEDHKMAKEILNTTRNMRMTAG